MIHRLTYFAFRVITATLEAMPLELLFRAGRLVGAVIPVIAPKYRKLAISNLRIVLGADTPETEIRRIAREHFRLLGANTLCGFKLAAMPYADLAKRVEIEGVDNLHAIERDNKGYVALISHQSCWEIVAQMIPHLRKKVSGAIYQRLGNPLIDAHVRQVREKHGAKMLDRRTGLGEAMRLARDGGSIGLLIDQHAGTLGIWTPLFGRLASTTPLPALLAVRGGTLVPTSVITTGLARWKLVFDEEFLPYANPEVTTAAVNRALEVQVRRSPADWFLVHDRWKTPVGDFLLHSSKRGVHVPEGETLKPFRILIRSSNWLGDAVMSVPTVRAFKRGRPDAHITILTPAKLASFWKSVTGVDDIIEIQPAKSGVFSVARSIKSKRIFDAAILFPNSLRSALEVWLGGIPVRVGFRGHNRRKLLTKIMPNWPRLAPPRAQVDVFMKLAEKCGANIDDPTLRDSLGAWKPDPSANYGVICPGAEYGPAKRWHPERFAECAKQLTERHGLKWVVVGTSKESELCGRVASLIGDESIAQNLAGKTTLEELAERLISCRILITNDTGTMHLAGLLGTPLVAIFGSTEPALTSPLGKRNVIVRRHVECSPCFLRKCPIDFRCMNEVTAERVTAAAETLLSC
jgi:lipopolysaccharide heptosyltransferase II